MMLDKITLSTQHYKKTTNTYFYYYGTYYFSFNSPVLYNYSKLQNYVRPPISKAGASRAKFHRLNAFSVGQLTVSRRQRKQNKTLQKIQENYGNMMSSNSLCILELGSIKDIISIVHTNTSHDIP